MIWFIVVLAYVVFNFFRVAKAIEDKKPHWVVGLNLFFGFFIWIYELIKKAAVKK